MIVFFHQLDAQILYFNAFIILLYMFRALICFSSEGKTLLVQHLLSSLSLGDCSVHRLRESCRNLCTEQSPKDSDDTRCCTNTFVLLKVTSPPVISVLNNHLNRTMKPDAVLIQFVLPKMSIVVLETCRGV